MMSNKQQPRITVSITKEELSQLPMANFSGMIKVVDNENEVASAIAVLKESDIIGFDTETRPSFRKGIINKVSLMQLSTRSCCFLFRLNKIGIPESLKQLLEDSSKLKIGLSIHDDFHNLRNLCDLSPAGFIDLQPYVKKFSIADNSLSRIYGILFGKRISKGQRLTNWEAEELTPGQQSYAALDAVACLEIYDEVTKGDFRPGLSPYMHPELEEERIERERREERERRRAELASDPDISEEEAKIIEAREHTREGAKKRRHRKARRRKHNTASTTPEDKLPEEGKDKE